MNANYTSDVRSMLANAQSEASRFCHEYIATEHLLLGLLKHAQGLAIKVFFALKVDPLRLRIEIEKSIQSGPESISMPKRPNTPRAAKVIAFAEAESIRMNLPYVGTGQFLIGLLSEVDGLAGEVLGSFGITLELVREALPQVAEKYGHELILPKGFSLDLCRVFGCALYELLLRSGISEAQIQKLVEKVQDEKKARTIAQLIACAESSGKNPCENARLPEALALNLADPLCALSDSNDPRRVLEALKTSVIPAPYAAAIVTLLT